MEVSIEIPIEGGWSPGVPGLGEIAARDDLHLVYRLDHMVSFEAIAGGRRLVVQGPPLVYEREDSGRIVFRFVGRAPGDRRVRGRRSAGLLLLWAEQEMNGFTLLGEVAS